jgi:hypothetical protein
VASYWVVVVAFGVWATALVIRVRVGVGQKMDTYVHKDGQSDCGKDSIMYIRPLSGNTEMLLMSHYMYGLSNSVRVGAF